MCSLLHTIPLSKCSCTFIARFCSGWVLPETLLVEMCISLLLSPKGSPQSPLSPWPFLVALFKTQLRSTFKDHFYFSPNIFRFDAHIFDKFMQKMPAKHRHLGLSAPWSLSHNPLCFPTSPLLRQTQPSATVN